MYKIESKIKNGGVWDGTKVLPFVDGVLETSDTALAEKCREMDGFTVTGDADRQDKFKGMDVEQLKAYAFQNNINIGASTSENGIIKKIEAAEAEKAKAQN